MKIRWPVLLVGIAIVTIAACSDDGPNLFRHDKESLVLFNRVTLASYAPDRAEIEIEVRTGSDFSRAAPDGTEVVLEASRGAFENDGRRIVVRTLGGRAVGTLVLPEPSRLIVSARSHDAEARLVIDVNDDGSIQLDPN